jgi:lipid-A-disaccharide synthase
MSGRTVKTVMVSAGDASGDPIAAGFVEALRGLRPDTRFLGLGGKAMERAGMEIVVAQRDVAVAGLVEVVRHLPRILGAKRRLREALHRERPDLVVLVDTPDFNLSFARDARAAGAKVLYYVSPQVWAWRRGRIHTVAERVDRLAVIFPFEVGLYAETGLQVDFVGHPSVDRMSRIAATVDRAGAREALGLDAAAPLVVLLPGSRGNEIRRSLPLYLDAARRLHARDARVNFVMALAQSFDRHRVESQIRAFGLPGEVRLDLVQGHTHAAIRAADAALAYPGTVTLEVALLGCPMVSAAMVNPLSAAIARRLVRVDHFTLPNQIAGRAIVPELLQEEARPEDIAAALVTLLDGPARAAQLEALEDMCARLGDGGSDRKVAAIAADMLSERS